MGGDDGTLIDVSVTVREGTPEWPGDTPYSCRWTWSMAEGATVNVSATTASPHVGTHADAPLHVKDGWPAADALPLAAFHGACIVVDVRTDDGEIGAARLDERLREAGAHATVERLLLRTGRTIADGAFPAAWPALAADAVALLLGRGLRLLGVDAPSVDARESTTLAVHHQLFGAEAYVLENLDLRDVEPGEYELTAYPQKLGGMDAAPVRAVLRRPASGPARDRR